MTWKVYDENWLTCGMGGRGKSYKIASRLKSLPKPVSIVVWDPNQQYDKPPLNITDWAIVHIQEGDALELSDERGIRVIVQPDEGSPVEFDQVVAAVLARGNTLLVIEEAQEVMGPAASKLVRKMIRTGRNFGVTWMAVTQLPFQLFSSVVANAHHKTVFRLERPEDTGYIAGWLGVDRGMIPILAKGQYLEKMQGQETLLYTPDPPLVEDLPDISTGSEFDIQEKPKRVKQ